MHEDSTHDETLPKWNQNPTVQTSKFNSPNAKKNVSPQDSIEQLRNQFTDSAQSFGYPEASDIKNYYQNVQESAGIQNFYPDSNNSSTVVKVSLTVDRHP